MSHIVRDGDHRSQAILLRIFPGWREFFVLAMKLETESPGLTGPGDRIRADNYTSSKEQIDDTRFE